MADRSVTVRFQTREEDYLARNPDGTLAGFNSRGEPLRASLEIDTDKTTGDAPYKLNYTLSTDSWRGQSVFLRYYSNSDETIVARTTNGEVVITAENLISEQKTESLVFTNEGERSISGIPSAGSVNSRWVGNVLSSGDTGGSGEAAALCSGERSGSGPNVTFDGEKLRASENVTGVLEVTYTETYAEIRSNAAEAGTVVVAVCQGSLAEAEQYEVEYAETTWRGNPDSECCQDGPTTELAIPAAFDADPGWDKAVYVIGGCPPFTWGVTGTGFSIKNAETEEARFNTVHAADDACGDGILTVTDACGDSVEAILETDEGCCEDQGGDPLGWADGNPDAICMSTTFQEPFGLSGGVPPYDWQVTIGDSVASWGNASTTDPANVLFATADEPTTVRLRVNDDCGEIIYRDISLGMEWSDDNPETIDQDDEVAVSVDGGIGPFHWSVSGTGFSMEVSETQDGVNLLVSDGSACGPASITVTDDCGQSVTGGVRCTEGSWDTTNSRALGGCDDDGMGERHYYFSPICRLEYACGAEGEGSSYCAPMEGVCAEFHRTVCYGSELCSVCGADSHNWSC